MNPREMALAAKELNALKTGERYTISKINPLGSLQARKNAAGLTVWWRFTLNYKYDEMCLGVLDPELAATELLPVDGRYSIAAAMRAAQDLAIRQDASLRAGGGTIKELLATEAAQAVAEREEETRYNTMTVAKLLELYASKQQGKTQIDVRSIFKNVPANIMRMPAKEATKTMWIALCKKVADSLGRKALGVRKPRVRTANKLRAYISAAYGMAAVGDGDMNVDGAFDDFGVTDNPIAGTVPRKLDSQGRNKNPLPAEDFRQYLSIIRGIDGIHGAVLRIHALTGGLRMEQLMRMPVASYDSERKVFTLIELKGGGKWREYTTPILSCLQKDFDLLHKANSGGKYFFSTTAGERQISPETVNGWVNKYIKPQMETFTPKRVRSGTTTELAKLGVIKEVRDQLQSHDINGVEEDHYQGHDWVPEKLEALTKLWEHLKPPEPEKTLRLVS